MRIKFPASYRVSVKTNQGMGCPRGMLVLNVRVCVAVSTMDLSIAKSGHHREDLRSDCL